MKRWYVITPEFEVYGGEYEPPELARDVAEVEAPTRRAARVAAVREWRGTQPWAYWVTQQAALRKNPYADLSVEPYEAEHQEPAAQEPG